MDDADFQTQPNDAYIKGVFSDVEIATPFFQKHLPAGVAATIDWTTLKVEPGSFVQESLRQSQSDLLFSARADGQPTLMYLLFEHQTTVDPSMPLRLLGYVAEILQAHHRQHGMPLPPVLPFVFNQGPDRWTVSTAFEDVFALPADASGWLPHLPKFNYALLDLTQLDPDDEADHDELRLAMQLMKMVRMKRAKEFLEWLARVQSNPGWHVRLPMLRMSFIYLLHADAVIDVDAISVNLSQHPTLKKEIMSLADRLIAQGEALGEARGEARGKAKGAWIGKIQVLEQLLGRGSPSSESLENLGMDELQTRFTALEQEYHSRFRQA